MTPAEARALLVSAEVSGEMADQVLALLQLADLGARKRSDVKHEIGRERVGMRTDLRSRFLVLAVWMPGDIAGPDSMTISTPSFSGAI